MDTKIFLPIALAAMSVTSFAQEPPSAQELLGDRILRMTEAFQIAYVNSDLDRGMPVDMSGPLGMLVLNRSSLVLPMLEKKIEQVLGSPDPLNCFTDKKVDPQYVIDLAASTITYAGDAQALKEASKLLKIDSKRFDLLVERALIEAISQPNPFTVAYQGFEIGDSEVNTRIAGWAEKMLTHDASQSETYSMRGRWAQAMVDKYGGTTTEVIWANDPIASRIKPELAASLHDDMFRLGAEAFQNRTKK